MHKRVLAGTLIAIMILTSMNFAVYAETEGADGQNAGITDTENKAGEDDQVGSGDQGSSGNQGGSENTGGSGDQGGSGNTEGTDDPAITSVKATNVRVVKKTSSVLKLTWDPIPQAASYEVYRAVSASEGTFVKVGTVTANTYYTSGLRGAWTYRFKIVPVLMPEYKDIKAYASDVLTVKMNNAAFSKTIPYVTVKNYKDPEKGLKPYNKVKWEKVSGARKYVIYRAKTRNGKYKKIATVKASRLSYNDKLAPSGKIAYYRVRAYKGRIRKTYSRYSDKLSIRTIHRVYIACGHGMQITHVWDGGCAYREMSEAKLMLPITKAMVKEMRESGVYVYTDADKNNNLNMTYCVRDANKVNVSVYMSIHCDYSGAPKGTLPLYYSKQDLKLAKALNKGVHGEISIADRGPDRRPDLFELRKPKAKASCIFETGSIKYDNGVFRNKYKAYGRGLAKGLCSYLGVSYHK